MIRLKDLEYQKTIYPSEYVAILIDIFQSSILIYEYQMLILFDSYHYKYLFYIWSAVLALLFLYRAVIIRKTYLRESDVIQRKIYLKYDIIIWFLCCVFGISLLKISIMGVSYEQKKNIFLHSAIMYLIFVITDIISLVYLPFIFHFIRFLPLLFDLTIFLFNAIYYLLIKYCGIYSNPDYELSDVSSFKSARSTVGYG